MSIPNFGTLTIRHAQKHQPWTVPYTRGVMASSRENNHMGVPHILGSHIALHITKTAGKIAAVFESLDHGDAKNTQAGITEEQTKVLKDMAADLVVEALRISNLYNFDLATEHYRRVAETNRKFLPPWD
jgi:hypothetical protein